MSEVMSGELSKVADGRRICLLDLNYTLVGNQQETRMLRPFTKRMQYEEYRRDRKSVV